MRSWLRQHRYALAGAWQHIRAPRGGFLLNVLVIAIALMLPFAGLTILENVRPVSEQLAVEPEISVFLATDVPREKATALAAAIRSALPAPATKLEFVPREKALTMLDEKTGLSAAVAALGSNPLPDAYVVRLAPSQSVAQAEKLDATVTTLKALPGVDHVQIDSAWVKRLAALMQLLRTGLLLLAATLAVVVVAVVFNTIRLQVLNQQEEIEVCQLVGASERFICRPFYYAGAFLGLCAGVVALGLVALTLYPLNLALADLVQLYGSGFMLQPLAPLPSALLLGASSLLGLLGALLSVQRTLRR